MKGRQIKLEVVSRIEPSSQTQSGIRVSRSALVLNENQGPFFIKPGTPDEVGTMIAMGLVAQAAIILIKNAEYIKSSRVDDREALIQSIADKIREGLILSDGLENGKFEDT